MPVKFSNSSGVLQSLIPAPLVSIRGGSVRDGNGTKLRNEYSITLNGTIVNIGNAKDSPSAQSYGFARMDDIVSEQARLKELFGNEGGQLELSDPEGSGTNNISCYCLVDSISFNPSTWTTRCDYTVDLRTNQLSPTPQAFEDIESTTNEWSVQQNPDGTVALTHNLSARGILTYAASGVVNSPLTSAKTWCQNRTYDLDANGNISPASIESFGLGDFITSLPSGNYWNKSVSETASSSTNTFSVSETFIYNPSGTQREEYSVGLSQNQDDPYRYNVSVNGTIQGFASADNNYGVKYTNASGYFENTVRPNLYSRVSAYMPEGFSLLVNPRSSQITHQIFNGVVDYSFSYLASSGTLIPNSINEEITISDTGQNDVFATIQVPGRANGPVVQYMGTKTLPERSVRISAQMSLGPITGGAGLPAASGLNAAYLAKPYTSDIVNALQPNAGNYYLTSDNEEWNPLLGQYSRSTSWTMNPESNTVYGLPSGVNTST